MNWLQSAKFVVDTKLCFVRVAVGMSKSFFGVGVGFSVVAAACVLALAPALAGHIPTPRPKPLTAAAAVTPLPAGQDGAAEIVDLAALEGVTAERPAGITGATAESESISGAVRTKQKGKEDFGPSVILNGEAAGRKVPGSLGAALVPVRVSEDISGSLGGRIDTDISVNTGR